MIKAGFSLYNEQIILSGEKLLEIFKKFLEPGKIGFTLRLIMFVD